MLKSSHPIRPAYVELHCKTNYSFLLGASHPAELVEQAAAIGHQALAITDRNSVAGIVRAHVAAKPSGLKLLIGAEIIPVDGISTVLLCLNRTGYANLCQLLTIGRRRAEKGECLLRTEDVGAYSDGLLAGVILKDADIPEAISPYREIFGDRAYGLASLHLGYDDAGKLNRLKDLARRHHLPLVASNDVHYHVSKRRILQDVLTAIRNGCPVAQLGQRRFSNGERFLKSASQMQELFALAPEAIEHTLEIADRCEFSLDELRYEYPSELCPEGTTLNQHLRKLVDAGARERYPQGVPEKITRTLEHELNLITQLSYESYFLTVHDLVRFARAKGILCQGRGSAANSVVCYCLGVTSVDPAEIDLLFERFISAERNEAPDIDIDFEHERREEIIQYVYQKYGRDRAGMTATVISYRPRSAIRDVGKALGLSLDRIESLSKGVEHYAGSEVFPRQFREQGLNLKSHVAQQLFALSRELLGFPRHLSQHVGGMVITQRPLCELVPIENASMPDRTVIQWDKNDLDAIGMLKVDCLSLGMLTVLRKSFDLIEEFHQRKLTLATIPDKDSHVYDMITRADTIGVFQVESRAQMAMHPRLKPKEFYDLVVAVAIVRPGPIQGGMVNPYLRRRAGEEPEEYFDERIHHILNRTLGVPLFQEQVMKLVMVAGGFSAGDADRLRRAMGGWSRSGSLKPFEEQLMQGMKANGYSEDFAARLFKMMQGFGEYGFPESHAASFALLAYASAWIKYHHPEVFCCALLNSQPMGFYAPAQLVRDAREHGVTVLPVDVNFSQWDCTLEVQNPADSQHSLRLGFRMLRGFSERDAAQLIASRSSRLFTSFEDFAERTAFNNPVLNRLSTADIFGSLTINRRHATWLALLPRVFQPLLDQQEVNERFATLPFLEPYEEVSADYRMTGLSLRSHPVSFLRDHLKSLGITPATDLCAGDEDRSVTVAGLVLMRQRPSTAKGITFVTLEDETGIVNLIVHQQIWNRYRLIAADATLMIASGQLQRQKNVIHVLVNKLQDGSHLLSGIPVKSRDFR